jgi:FAD/FMN-containing dehydrogenase
MSSGRFLGPNSVTDKEEEPAMQGSSKEIDELRAVVQGRVIAPGDDVYDEARAVFYGGFDRRPAAVVRVANADDVVRVVRFARNGGLELAVRSGGHSVAGHSATDGGIVLDLADMKALGIDAEERTAWAETGLTAGEYTAAAGGHGLVTGFGDTASVGIGGITLGGGVGYLVRKYGLSIDDLLGAEIVTADGERLVVDEASHPDLFWAIRGGGGNFGVATRFRFRLHELPTVVGGMLFLPGTADVVEGFVAAAQTAPEELSTIANVMPAPPMPFVPEEHHGRMAVMALMAYAGDPEAGQRALAPFRALATPIADLLRPMPYADIYPPEQPGFHPIASSHTMLVDSLERSTLETALERLETSEAMMRAIQIRALGGAMARVPADATAFAHRDRKFLVNVAAMYERPEESEEYGPWVAALAAEFERGRPAAYVGFLGDEGESRVRDAYPAATWDRLVEVKRRYDPTNLFRLNQNIPPTEPS